jgi:hypothetical protein
MHFLQFHVEFQDGLTIHVFKIRTTCREHLQLEIEKFLKKSTVFKARLPYSFISPALLKS